MPAAQKERALVQVYVSPETADRLKSLAREGERTLSGELRLAIRSHLNDESQPRQAGSVQESSRQARHGQRT